MISTPVMAKFIQAEINKSTADEKIGLSFKIYTEHGDIKTINDASNIKAHLHMIKSDPVPVSGYVNVVINYRLSFLTAVTRGNNILVGINTVIQNLINALNDTNHAIAGGYGHFTFQTPESDKISKEAGIGEGTVIELDFAVNYTKTGAGSAFRKWFLDDIELPYLRATTSLNKSGATNKVSGMDATQSLSVEQTREHQFILPFDKSNTN